MWKFIAVVIVIILLLCFFIAIIYTHNRTRLDSLAFEFNGKVENVSYDAKGEPTVIIDGREYNLPVNFWNFKHKIQKGDSLTKQKNTMVIKLIKQKTNEVLLF